MSTTLWTAIDPVRTAAGRLWTPEMAQNLLASSWALSGVAGDWDMAAASQASGPGITTGTLETFWICFPDDAMDLDATFDEDLRCQVGIVVETRANPSGASVGSLRLTVGGVSQPAYTGIGWTSYTSTAFILELTASPSGVVACSLDYSFSNTTAGTTVSARRTYGAGPSSWCQILLV